MKYSISRNSGLDFHDDPCKIFIVDLVFRVDNKFTCDYDFGDDWEYEIRVEKIEEFSAKYVCSSCKE